MLPQQSPDFLLWNLSPLLWSSLQDPMVYMNDKSPLVSYLERPVRATAYKSLIHPGPLFQTRGSACLCPLG